MMSSLEKESNFIINILKTWDKLFNDINIRYAYEKDSDFHIIEVSPESIRRGNDEFIEMEYQLNNQFYNEFKNDDILISEPCEFNDMSNILYSNRL